MNLLILGKGLTVLPNKYLPLPLSVIALSIFIWYVESSKASNYIEKKHNKQIPPSLQ